MPEAAHRESRKPLCSAYAVCDGLCTAHFIECRHATQQASRGPAGANLRPSNSRFRWMRKAYLKRHPFCAQCGEPGGILDHITPHRGNIVLFWDESNWQALCVRCHGVKTARETLHRGRWDEKLPTCVGNAFAAQIFAPAKRKPGESLAGAGLEVRQSGS